jgi:hypothetical protein
MTLDRIALPVAAVVPLPTWGCAIRSSFVLAERLCRMDGRADMREAEGSAYLIGPRGTVEFYGPTKASAQFRTTV